MCWSKVAVGVSVGVEVLVGKGLGVMVFAICCSVGILTSVDPLFRTPQPANMMPSINPISICLSIETSVKIINRQSYRIRSYLPILSFIFKK